MVDDAPPIAPTSLDDAEIALIDRYWRAANYLSVGQIYLLDNPLLREPLAARHVKPRLLGHWGTTPGLNFVYVHLNRIIRARDADVLYVCGPGHGGPGMVANTYLEGTYSEIYPQIGQDEDGLRRLFRQFAFPGGIPSHAAPETPGSIHEGGEALLRSQAEDIGDQVVLVARTELEIGHTAVRRRHGALEHRSSRLLAGGERGEGRQAVRPAGRRRAAHDMAVGAPAFCQGLAAQHVLRIGQARQQHGAGEYKVGVNPGGFHDSSTERPKTSRLPQPAALIQSKATSSTEVDRTKSGFPRKTANSAKLMAGHVCLTAPDGPRRNDR
jgi:hypothetical protein